MYFTVVAEALGEKDYPVHRLRLFFGGKQLEDGNTLFEYDIKNGNIVLVSLKAEVTEESHVRIDKTEDFCPSQQLEPEKIEEPSGVEIGVSNVSLHPSEVYVTVAAPVNSEEVPEEDYFCNRCKNNPKKNCKECGCSVCGKKDDEEHTIVCDECESYFHWACLKPEITVLPPDDWYCSQCRHDDQEVLTAGKKLDISKTKKAKMASATQTKQWGGGMACVGRSKTCTIVDKDHVGKIPGIPVGSSWLYRINCSEAGVHRPHVAGIAGSSQQGAVSLVLSGGYPEDVDNGEEFTYTGAGGRDLSGNKRTNEQSKDQELKLTNLALARTCNASINEKTGAKAKDWRKSQPIRVVRGHGLNKHNPKYAPKEGCRYDGLYKLVEYWREKGKNKFYVWRYRMRRDDDEPAPWTLEGKARVKKLGLEMYVPEDKKEKGSKTSTKRKDLKADSSDELAESSENIFQKKIKLNKYNPTTKLKTLIKNDKRNTRAWALVLEAETTNEAEFIDKVREEFMCPVCQEMAKFPVTTPCEHNACRVCLERALENNDGKCPTCRFNLQSSNNNQEMKKIKDVLEVNKDLIAIINHLVPSYHEVKPQTTGKKKSSHSKA
ncbi:hypothetical protein G9A89_015396 [Geosiphon pyriformis]|nr:hypothetical protein G9A89_015396 [Geosiphon pyriformis]